MNSDDIIRRLMDIGLVPVIRVDAADQAIGAVKAIIQAGLPVAEITLTVPGAMEVLAALDEAFGDRLLLGAGTVTEVDQARQAIKAGSRFIVTPAACLEVVAYCRKEDTCVIGGGLTPTEVLSVWRAGADAVKVFPVKAVGGPEYIRLLREPFPDIPLVPTGGVDLDNVADFFDAGAAFIGVGGRLVNRSSLARGDLEAITRQANLFLAAIRSAKQQASAFQPSSSTSFQPR
ncbi:MAG: bifunctional 4-hydroxy-2-oxoglutarate aldolase/2-dehydro-3-deoxy-phosphogluconate aldolase [Thermodesulfobacteriota bacterium]